MEEISGLNDSLDVATNRNESPIPNNPFFGGWAGASNVTLVRTGKVTSTEIDEPFVVDVTAEPTSPDNER